MVMDKFRKFFILFFKAAMSECGPSDFSSSKTVNTSDRLSEKQRHDMDSNGLSRSEAIRNPHW